MRSRYSLSLGLLAGLALALAMAVAPAQAVTVSVQPPDTTVYVNDQFALRIETTAFPDLKGFELIFSYDPTLVQFMGADPGDVLTGSGNPFSAYLVPDFAAPADSIWYDAAMLVGSTQGPGILAFFKFKALAIGDCPIQCRFVDYRDSFNNQTLPDCVGGMVHIISPVPARRSTWGSLKTLYR